MKPIIFCLLALLPLAVPAQRRDTVQYRALLINKYNNQKQYAIIRRDAAGLWYYSSGVHIPASVTIADTIRYTPPVAVPQRTRPDSLFTRRDRKEDSLHRRQADSLHPRKLH